MEEMAIQVRSYASPGWIVGNPYLGVISEIARHTTGVALS